MRSYWDEDLAILSAENVHFSVETAGLGSRFAAAAIDLTIQGLVALLISLATLGITSYFESSVSAFAHSLPKWALYSLAALTTIFFFLLAYGYYFFFEWLWDGQTPGKRYLGLRVMMGNGMPLTMWPALTRNIVRIVDFFPVCYGFGAVVAWLNPLNQRAGDLVAGTIVARERRQEKERRALTISEAVDLFLQASTTVPGQKPELRPLEDEELAVEIATKIDPEAAALSLKLTREDYELARDFLLRRDKLPREARERLGRSLGARLSAKIGVSHRLDERFLEEIVATLSRAYGF